MKYDVIIVGSGISGLSFAHHCAKDGLSVLVLEANSKLGGHFDTLSFDDNFWLDLGAHTCYNTYTNLIQIINDFALATPPYQRREKVSFKMFTDGKVRSIFKELKFFELLTSIPHIFFTKKNMRDVKSYYSKILGTQNYQRVFGPAMNAVISQEAAQFPSDILFKKRNREKSVYRSFTFTEGISKIIELIKSESKIECLKNSAVLGVSLLGNGHYQLKTKEGSFEAERLVLATPANTASLLVENLNSELASVLAKIDTKQTETVGIVVNKEASNHLPLFAGLIAKDESFFSIVSRDVVFHDKYRGFATHFRPNLFDESEKIKIIIKTLGLKKEDILKAESKKGFLPSLKLDHKKIITDIDRIISQSNIFIVGNYFAGLAIEDCLIRSSQEFTRLKALGDQIPDIY